MTLLVALLFIGSTAAISLVVQTYFLRDLFHPMGDRSSVASKS